ncbi:MAG: (4Fe-4S)-binding protein [Bacteroidales bacterium]|jgi:uncharacterized Fe-S cluster protein YjdI|nr:(4Fe-4S)-binding protein [Bacteroidales bacterium]MDD2688144.1 (4Fe-4S)-binding protein [Bacteroidales bacterium]MDD3329726.1 (4Fe-4S)-binding protein [Bacteroidales bacterium]MDD3690484.1 (4Fe-4S)-binding protein [Bacteroidales bacterium]MDD4044325.1 (4Fe-4S)-binding protein [Bacteroidales bacterium]
MEIVKKYTNGEITIVWKPKLCTFATYCFKLSPTVFKPKERPWIQPENESTKKMISTIEKCPSGALTYYYNTEKQSDE